MTRTVAFIEARDEKGLKYLVRVIRAGLSSNRNHYPDSVLRESTPLFEGVRVFVKPDAQHIRGGGKDFRNLIGRITNPAFVTGSQSNTGEIQAELQLLQSAGEVVQKLREAYERGMADDLFGFSIDAEGTVTKRRGGIREAQSINKVNSLDLIIEPSAGGQILKLIEAVNDKEESEVKLRERMIETVKAANNGKLPDGLDIENDEALEVVYREALKPNTSIKTDGKDAARAGGPGQQSAAAAGTGAVDLDLVEEKIRMVEARANMRVAIAQAKLPDKAKDKLLKQFGAMERFTEAQVAEAIKDMRELAADFSQAGHVQGMGEGSLIESGEDRSEKVSKMLDSFFDPNDRSVVSFRECYIEITGDKRVTGSAQDVDMKRLREAAGDAAFREAISAATFAEILGDSITRRMVADYADPVSRYASWRMLANVVPVSDFRTNRRTRMGGYGSLPAVAENGAYGALTSPADEEATYAATKRGGKETISIETIKNDDVGAIRQIPIRLSKAAQRTLARFVFDFIVNNAAIYDSVALFHATHGNLGAAALDATTLAAARLAMLKQTEAGSSERLGIAPAHLWVPSDLEESAFDLFRRTTNNDTDFVETLDMAVHPVWYWTDANDWAVSADPTEIPTIEIGFLDGNEEPELFVQDNPTQGSLFSNDQIVYKIRHIYGGAVMDYRGLYKAVVA